MSRLIAFVTMLWCSTASAQLLAGLKFIQDAGTKEVSAITDPVAKVVVGVGFSQCATVKNVGQLSYEDYKGNEPDLSKLTIDFISRSVNITYSLSDLPDELPKSNKINFNKTLIIYLHGFTDDPTKGSYANISNAFLLQDDMNIVALDASSLIRWLYLRSSTMVHFIGEKLGETLAALYDKGLLPFKIHLIGHSLGSHIAGFCGKKYKELTGMKIGRISGLDPAGPCFADVNSTLKLNKDDADFVDVIHTDAGVFGLNEQVGHVDFYPNSGSQQPGCLFQTCSHSRAWLLYAESVVNRKSFPAVKCKDWKSFKEGNCDNTQTSFMGFDASNDTSGNYYLQTNEVYPYARGEDGLKFNNNIGVIRNIGGALGILQK